MKKIIKNFNLYSIWIIIFTSCEREDIGINDIITLTEVSKSQLYANGSDISRIKIFYNENSEVEKIKLNVEVNNGVFVESNSNKIEVNAEKDSVDNIFSEISLKSSTMNTDHELNFKVDKFERKTIIKSIKSVPHSIKISSNSFSVNNNFNSEVTIEGLLSSNIGKKVSQGAKVTFTDTFLDGSGVNGVFRNSMLTSNSDSKVSTIYSPGVIAANQYIVIKVEVLDENDLPTGIIDSLQVYVNNEN